MKNCKLLIIALLFSILTLPSSGQSRRYDDYGRSSRSGSAIKGVEWGVLAGLNFPHFSTSGPDFGIDNRLGWQAGLQIGLKFRYFTIGPEVLYVRQSIKLSHADYGTLKIKTNSIDIPLIFSLRALPMLRINVGPVFTVKNISLLPSAYLQSFITVKTGPTVIRSIGSARRETMRGLSIDVVVIFRVP